MVCVPRAVAYSFHVRNTLVDTQAQVYGRRCTAANPAARVEGDGRDVIRQGL